MNTTYMTFIVARKYKSSSKGIPWLRLAELKRTTTKKALDYQGTATTITNSSVKSDDDMRDCGMTLIMYVV